MALLTIHMGESANVPVTTSTGSLKFGTVFRATIGGVRSIYLIAARGVVDLGEPTRDVYRFTNHPLRTVYLNAVDYVEAQSAVLTITF